MMLKPPGRPMTFSVSLKGSLYCGRTLKGSIAIFSQFLKCYLVKSSLAFPLDNSYPVPTPSRTSGPALRLLQTIFPSFCPPLPSMMANCLRTTRMPAL